MPEQIHKQNPFGKNYMSRLSLAEIKAKVDVVANLEAINGGMTDNCHGALINDVPPFTPTPGNPSPRPNPLPDRGPIPQPGGNS